MRLRFLWIGKTRDPLLDELERRYRGRLERHFRVETSIVPDLKKTDPRQRAASLGREADRVLQQILPGTHLIVLDGAGRQFSSPELAALLGDWMSRSLPEVVFLGGGHLGVPSQVVGRAQTRISLGPLTFPHELARVLLLEQIYRAVTIIKGLPYHK